MEIFTVRVTDYQGEKIISEKWGGYASEDNYDLHAPILLRRHLIFRETIYDSFPHLVTPLFNQDSFIQEDICKLPDMLLLLCLCHRSYFRSVFVMHLECCFVR